MYIIPIYAICRENFAALIRKLEEAIEAFKAELEKKRIREEKMMALKDLSINVHDLALFPPPLPRQQPWLLRWWWGFSYFVVVLVVHVFVVLVVVLDNYPYSLLSDFLATGNRCQGIEGFGGIGGNGK